MNVLRGSKHRLKLELESRMPTKVEAQDTPQYCYSVAANEWEVALTCSFVARAQGAWCDIFYFKAPTMQSVDSLISHSNFSSVQRTGLPLDWKYG